MFSPRLQGWVKHAFDRLVAALLLFVLALGFGAIAAMIKLEDGGPVFFSQVRAGRNGSTFRILKFRTMIQNADDYLDEDGRPLRTRVTRVGRYLRRWSLDELPQLINVLRGEMSLVGPRPVPVEYAERMTSRQRTRFAMLPGLTGLAQVTGRHKLPWSERVKLDVEYVESFSLPKDFAILARTIPILFDSETLTDRGDPRKVDFG